MWSSTFVKFVFVCIYIYIYTYIYIYIYIYIFTQEARHVRMYANCFFKGLIFHWFTPRLGMSMCTYAYMYVYEARHVCMCVRNVLVCKLLLQRLDFPLIHTQAGHVHGPWLDKVLNCLQKLRFLMRELRVFPYGCRLYVCMYVCMCMYAYMYVCM